MHRRLPVPRIPRLRLVALALLAAIVVGCSSPAASPAGTAGPSGEVPSGAAPSGAAPSGGGEIALVSVEYRGGHCRVGECRSVVTISPTGTVQRDLGPKGSIPQPLLAALVDAIRATDFAAVLARPFTGECPTAFDGQELVYTIATPSNGQVVIASCTIEVDPGSPLFAAIERIVEIAP